MKEDITEWKRPLHPSLAPTLVECGILKKKSWNKGKQILLSAFHVDLLPPQLVCAFHWQ